MRLGTYKGIHMTRPNTEVTKHEVLNVLKKKQKEYAVATNIDDRSAQEGDQVTLIFKACIMDRTSRMETVLILH